ncbi:MAG: THUMP domain-containing protein [Aigarchaeota archaeon]|nr:THUMP domain-containing protein [Aigarchaeota archaeon]
MERQKFFFLISGEYETIPMAELKSVLNILDPGHELVETSPTKRILVINTYAGSAKAAVERAAYTKLCCRLITVTETSKEIVLNSVTREDIAEIFPEGVGKFAVRGKRIGGAGIDKTSIERELGAKILNLSPGLRVDLENPDSLIFFISEPELTYIGVLAHSKPKNFFNDRTAGRRPFSLPSAMQPDFSRAMVNLAEVRLGGSILDPFSGTGGIMIEAGLLGYDAYGVELKEWIAKGALRNLRRYLPGREFMIVGDARNPVFRNNVFDAIVTDPPYGRSTTIPSQSIRSLLSKFFEESIQLLKDRGRVVMASPVEVGLEEMTMNHGLKLLGTHLARVHGSLVRKVVVMKK